MITAIDPLISLPATDAARAFRFYRDAVGLVPVLESPESGFYILRGPAEGAPLLGVHQHEGTIAPLDAQGVWIWLQVESIADARARLEAHGVGFVGAPSPLGPGVQQPFVDSEGNVVRLWEPLRETARTRRLAAPVDAVWAALTQEAALAHWFPSEGPVRIDATPGGTMTFRDARFGDVEGTVVRAAPPEPGPYGAPGALVVALARNWPRELSLTVRALASSLSELEVRLSDFAPVRDRDFGIPALLEHLDLALTLVEQAACLATQGLGADILAREIVRDAVAEAGHASDVTSGS